MAGAEPHRSRAEEQGSFKQAMVDQVIHAADKAQHHQGWVMSRHAGDECPEAEQDNADVFQGVVRQQALNIVLHQGVQPADEGGDHPQHQQHHSPPQRRNAAGQRDRQDAVQTDLHHYRRKQRGSRSAGASVGLRRPAVQRNDPGQQRKADQARQPQ